MLSTAVMDACERVASSFEVESGTSTCTWCLRASAVTDQEMEQLRNAVADLIVLTRCPELYDAWNDRVEHAVPHDPATLEALTAFLRPVFGLQWAPHPPDHAQAAVAAMVWFALCVSSAAATNQVSITDPQFAITDPGGDGLTFHANPDQTPEWWFRLWEIKKATGSKKVAATARDAAEQLAANGAEYLARFKKANESHGDYELRVRYSLLVEYWIARTDHAGAGISVATKTGLGTRRSFQSMANKLPGFASASQLLGEANSCPDLAGFSSSVAERIWKGL